MESRSWQIYAYVTFTNYVVIQLLKESSSKVTYVIYLVLNCVKMFVVTNAMILTNIKRLKACYEGRNH